MATLSSSYTIGTLARAAQVNVETIRYYQRRGLLPRPAVVGGGYRTYSETDLARLRAIKRAQHLGFSLEEIETLLSLNEETDRVKARNLAQDKVSLIDARIVQLMEMRNALAELVDCCRHGDTAAPCPILRALSA
ncbi:MerR family transcriptional regulator [Azoarcus sp. TTM-91]|uniref:MerR family transcriptional regulator n=1 Tax=Azoarcus sp. TTM-91 TaxID=2691581 RepID=UPI00145F4C44|nr:MerR family transcriptional regulator [Azoarcus sp. TTM-91]NMG34547.1 MerR family transcriptional regulator [Azoarcus sp. TTM-91]